MQGQRRVAQSLLEAFEIDTGHTPSDSRQYWNTTTHVGEAHTLHDYLLSPNDHTSVSYTNPVNNHPSNLNDWLAGETSNIEHNMGQSSHDQFKNDGGWSSSLTIHTGPPLEEGRFQQTDVLSLENVNINLNSNTPRELVHPNPVSVFDNATMDSPFSGTGTGTQPLHGISSRPNANKSVVEQVALFNSPDPGQSSSCAIGNFPEDTHDRPSCSIEGKRLKRKSFEIVSGQGSSSSSSHPEESPQLTPPAHQNDNSFFSYPPPHLANITPEGSAGSSSFIAPGFHPSISNGNDAEESRRSFRLRVNPSHPQEPTPPRMWPTGITSRRSHIWPTHPSSSRLLQSSRLVDMRSIIEGTSSPQPNIQHTSSVHRNLQSTGRSLGRGPTSSRSQSLRDAALPEDGNPSPLPRTSREVTVSPPSELRHLLPDPINWGPVTGGTNSTSSSSSRTVYGTGASGGLNGSRTSQSIPLPHYNRALSDLFRRPYAGPDGGAPSSSLSPLPPVPATSATEMVLSNSAGVQVHQRHQRHLPRTVSSVSLDRLGDTVLGVPLALRNLMAEPEGHGRLRFLSEFLRRGERFEDVFLLDHAVFLGGGDLHDRHRDMRLDVDSMSYEELLALEERIGDVNTGLSEETVFKCLKQRKYSTSVNESSMEIEPCCVCQEEYVDGEELGSLDCGHDFHTNCIKQWLMHKNLCPICKTTALVTT